MDIMITAHTFLDIWMWEARGRAAQGEEWQYLASGKYPQADCPTLEDEADWLCQQVATEFGAWSGPTDHGQVAAT